MKSTDSIVYLIEDDEGSLASTECLLGVHGFRTKSFTSAEQFFDDTVEEPTGCIVTDLVLPGISGLELFERTRELGWKIPFIMLTAFSDVPSAVHALRSGILDFLEKPFPAERLIQSVSECLAR
jgi:FixJ family two-component response regulator